jgi:hypothetical protein
MIISNNQSCRIVGASPQQREKLIGLMAASVRYRIYCDDHVRCCRAEPSNRGGDRGFPPGMHEKIQSRDSAAGDAM